MNTRQTVIGTVFKDLNTKLETGVYTVDTIKSLSQYQVDKYVDDFIREFSHLIPYPYARSTVNRCIEKWLKQYR